MFKTIKAKLSLLLASILVFTLGSSLIVTQWEIEHTQQENLGDSFLRAEQVIDTLMAAQRSNLANQSQLVGELPILSTVVENGDGATILNSAQSYQQQLKLSILDILDDEGEILASVNDNFDATTITPETDLIIRVLEEGQVNTSLIMRHHQLTLLAAAPIGIPDEPSGVLLAGTFLNDSFAKKIKSLTKAEISFWVDGKIVGSSLVPALRI